MQESSGPAGVSACTAMPTSDFEPGRAALCFRRVLVDSTDFIVDVHCDAGRSSWSEVEQATDYALVLPRSGYFERRADGTEMLVDAGVAYFRAPGEEQQVAHPTDGGDRCTTIGFKPTFIASLWGGDPVGLPEVVFSTRPLDLAHRQLLASLRAGAPAPDVEELVGNFVAAALAQYDARRVDSGRPASAALRRRIVRDARHLLADDPTQTLAALAHRLAVSPHHLSRIFSAATGVSVTTYRNRLRARAALERIADGERSLTRRRCAAAVSASRIRPSRRDRVDRGHAGRRRMAGHD
jgi:AraC-like DNA-binding protein